MVYSTGPMLYRPLGKTGLSISEVSLGSWLTYGDRIDGGVTKGCVRAAFDVGVNFFDTADVYTGAEAVLGEALRELPRSEYVVATKCFFPMSKSPLERGLSRKHVVDSVHRSLRALGTDYIDVMQCHRYDAETPVEETSRALEDLVTQGKILYWGVSRWTAPQLDEAAAAAARSGVRGPIVSQVPYNMLYREFEAEVLPRAHALGMGSVVYSPLAQGVLSGKYTDGVAAGSRANDAELAKTMHQLTPASIARVEHLRPIARELGMPMARLALAWCLRRPEVTSVITGASRPEQIRENSSASGAVIPPEALQRIDAILGETT